jgi:hypothetical protein
MRTRDRDVTFLLSTRSVQNVTSNKNCSRKLLPLLSSPVLRKQAGGLLLAHEYGTAALDRALRCAVRVNAHALRASVPCGVPVGT